MPGVETAARLTRRTLFRSSVAIGLAAAGSYGPSGRSATAQDQTTNPGRRPDFVVVVTDDMRDTDWQALPRTRTLLDEVGVWFPNFFLTTPTCGPSRASLLTGLYAHEHGIFLGDDKDRVGGVTAASMFDASGLPDRTIARALQDAGYRTALIGKYLNGYGGDDPVPVGWDDWFVTYTTRYVDFKLNEGGSAATYRDGEYLTDVLADVATTVIETTPAEQPLFLYFAPKAPHAPTVPATRHQGAFADAVVEDDPAIGEVDVSDKPAFLRELRDPDRDELTAEEAKRLESLLAVDEAVVRLIEALRAAGRLDNTYVFVLSDNGFAMGQHRWRAKGLPYDTVARVSMLAAGPGFTAGTTDERLVANIDIAPTIAEAAGVDLPRASGRSLLSDGARAAILLENTEGEQKPAYQALRGDGWLYIEWGTGERELYHGADDPFELENLLADWEGHRPAAEALAIGDALGERLAAMARCIGNECFAIEQVALGV